MIADDDLGFEIPVNYVCQDKKFVPNALEAEFLSQVPDLIFGVIRHVLPRAQTVDPITPFYFLKMGKFPKWVVKWFVEAQRPSRFGNATLFFRALHCIEQIRAFSHDIITVEDLMNRTPEDEFTEEDAERLDELLFGKQNEGEANEEEGEANEEEGEAKEEEPKGKRKAKGKGKGKGKRSKRD